MATQPDEALAAFRFLKEAGFTCDFEEEGIEAVRELLDIHTKANELRALARRMREKEERAEDG